MCYITVFGPTHSGKSTLMGYISTFQFDDQQYKGQLKEIRKKIQITGESYYQDMALAYFFDTGLDERHKYTSDNESSIGTTKRIHIIEGVDTDITYIDTPGSDAEMSNKYNGQFMGEYGIYIVETGLFEHLREYSSMEEYRDIKKRIFAPLFLWNAYKEISNVIMVISKFDQIAFDMDLFHWAKKTIQNYFEHAAVIPISINVYARKGYNIYPTDEKIPEYTGHCLIDSLSELIKNKPERNSTNTVFAFIDAFFENKKVIRVKMLSGQLKKGDMVTVGPLKKDKENDNVFLQGYVESIYENGIRMSCLETGRIGSLKITEICQQLCRKTKRKKDYRFKSTTILFGNSSFIQKGNLVQLTVSLDNLKSNDLESLLQFRINDQIVIIWMGKSIFSSVAGIIKTKNQIILTILNHSSEPSMFALVMDEHGQFLYNAFVIKLKNEHFICCRLNCIEELKKKKEICLEFINEINYDFSWDIKEHFGNCIVTQTLPDKYLVTLNARNLKNLSAIRKFVREYGITDYSVIFR